MVDVLADVIKDPDAGLYASRILGSRGQDCQFDANTSILSNTCLFRSDDQLIDLTYWSNDLEINRPGSSGNIDLGFQREGYMYHVDFGEIYVKPNIYSRLSVVDVWIKSNRVFNSQELGWLNFNRSNILRHWAFNPANMQGANFGNFQHYVGVFMYRESSGKYHAFVLNSIGQIFVSDGLENLSSINSLQVNYYQLI